MHSEPMRNTPLMSWSFPHACYAAAGAGHFWVETFHLFVLSAIRPYCCAQRLNTQVSQHMESDS